MENWKKHNCWKCGKRKAKILRLGFPICRECDDDTFDPESMEGVVINAYEKGYIEPYDKIKKG